MQRYAFYSNLEPFKLLSVKMNFEVEIGEASF